MSDLFQTELRTVLNEAFAKRKAKNPRFSLRGFAKLLGIQPSALSEILNDKRHVSLAYAQALLERVGTETKTKDRLLKIAKAQETAISQKNSERVQLLDCQYHILSDWSYLAAIALAETENFSGTEQEISQRLGIAAASVTEMVSRLVRLGLMQQDGEGRISATGKQYTTTDDVPNEWLRLFYEASLKRTLQSLKTDPVTERDFISATFAMEPEILPHLKVLIREFVEKFSSLAEASSAKRIYRLGIQLIPLSDCRGTM